MTQPALAPLAAWAARLADLAPDAVGVWKGGETVDGATQMPWFEDGPIVTDFLAEAQARDWVRPGLDWPAWAAIPRNRALVRDAEAILSHATAEDLFAILTVHIRSSRYNEGAMAEALNSGIIAAVARRAVLLEGSAEEG